MPLQSANKESGSIKLPPLATARPPLTRTLLGANTITQQPPAGQPGRCPLQQPPAAAAPGQPGPPPSAPRRAAHPSAPAGRAEPKAAGRPHDPRRRRPPARPGAAGSATRRSGPPAGSPERPHTPRPYLGYPPPPWPRRALPPGALTGREAARTGSGVERRRQPRRETRAAPRPRGRGGGGGGAGPPAEGRGQAG